LGTNGWINTTGVNIKSNYYYVDITLVVGTAPDTITKNFRHVLHVYQNMTSTFTYIFTDDHIGGGQAQAKVSFTPKIVYEHPKDNPPKVTVTSSTGAVPGTDGSEKNPYILSLADDTALALTVTATTGTYSSVAYFNGSTSLTLTSGNIIDSTVGPFDEHGKYSVTVVGTQDGIPYDTEIFIQVIATSVPKLSTNTGYNPAGLEIESITVDGGTTTITVTSTGIIPNAGDYLLGFDTKVQTEHNPAWLTSTAKAQGWTVLTLNGLYDTGLTSGSVTDPLIRRLETDALNMYNTPNAAWHDVNTPGKIPYLEGSPALYYSNDPYFHFILWNGSPTKIITFKVTQYGVTTTYIIDYNGVNIGT
jgi:hypothetical protein